MYQAAVIVLVCALYGVEGYGTGAPPSACTSMLPGHTGTQPQTSISPYTISTGSTTYKAGTPISVRVTGSRAFQGLLVQARVKGTSTIVGTWSSSSLPAATRLTSCSGADNSWTHSSTASKQDVSHSWNPPSGDQGQIEFVATVLENKNTYWLNHKTAALSYNSGTVTQGPGGGNQGTVTQGPGGGSSTVHLSGVLTLGIALLWKVLV